MTIQVGDLVKYRLDKDEGIGIVLKIDDVTKFGDNIVIQWLQVKGEPESIESWKTHWKPSVFGTYADYYMKVLK